MYLCHVVLATAPPLWNSNGSLFILVRIGPIFTSHMSSEQPSGKNVSPIKSADKWQIQIDAFFTVCI